MAILDDVPTEILMFILEYLRDVSSPGQYSTALLTCRKWYDAGLSTLYRHVHLKSGLLRESSISRFCSTAVEYDQVHSLTYCFDDSLLSGCRHRLAEADARVKQMASVLPRCSRLYSLTIYQEQRDYERPCLQDDCVINILQALPDTVKALDIDMVRHHDMPAPNAHVCTILSSLFRRLRHLRISPALLNECFANNIHSALSNGPVEDPESKLNESNLETLILYGDFTPLSARTLGLQHAFRHCVLPRRVQPDSGANAYFFETKMQELYKLGAFPRLKTGVIIQQIDRSLLTLPSGIAFHEILNPVIVDGCYDTYKIYDLVRDQKTSFPTRRRGGTSQLAMIRALDGSDFFGTSEELRDAIEPGVWKSHRPGRFPVRRFPVNPHGTRSKSIDQHGFDARELMTRDTTIERHGVNMPLWQQEATEGQQRIHARRAPGCNDVWSICEWVVPDVTEPPDVRIL